MLIDRPQVSEGSVIVNATIPSGPSFPADPSPAELYFLTSGEQGLYCYANGWVRLSLAQELALHVADDSRHITASQNTFLDGINVNSATVNSIPALTTSQNQTATALTDHVNDLTKHLTAQQDTLLDGLNPSLTAAEVNQLMGVTSPIQPQLNSIVAINTQQTTAIEALTNNTSAAAQSLRADLDNHVADDTRHITAAQNTFLDSISVGASDVNKLAGLAGFLGVAPLASYLATQNTAKLNVDGSNAMTGILNMGSNRITNVATPTGTNDAVNKAYVDNMAQGIRWAAACRATTTANITLSGLQTIDGVALAVGNRVLVKDQTDQTQNGIWLAATGAWSRAADYDAPNEVNSSAIFVVEGTAWPKSTWVQTATVAAVGSDPIQFSLFSGINDLTGAGGIVMLSTKSIEVDLQSGGGLMLTMDNVAASTNPDAKIALTNVGTPGTYTSVTVDAKGRITAGTNPTTLAGYGITDATTPAQLAAKVSKTGDSMSSGLVIGVNAVSDLAQALPSLGSIGLNSNATTAPAAVSGYRNGSLQWRIDMPATGTAGNFLVQRFASGDYQDAPLSIDKPSGVVTATLGLNTTVLNASASVSTPMVHCYGEGIGRIILRPGTASNTGYVEFIRATAAGTAPGVRQGYIGFSGTTATTTDGGAISYVSATHSFNGNMTVSGSITAQGDVTAFSDRRVKDDIETIKDALAKVNELRGVTYTKDGQRGLGVIAQEVQAVVPEVVRPMDEYLTVAYGNMVGLLIEAVKELTVRVQELEKK